MFEIETPKRRYLRRKGESDSRDAESAARAALAGETAGEPKSADGRVEMIRVLRAARRSAVKGRTQAANQLRGPVVTAPEELQQRLRGLSTRELVAVAAGFRPAGEPGTTWKKAPSSPYRWFVDVGEKARLRVGRA